MGEIICRKMKEERRTKKWLAAQVNRNYDGFCKILKKSYIDTDLLMNICFALQHDFFQYITFYYYENQQHKKPAITFSG